MFHLLLSIILKTYEIGLYSYLFIKEIVDYLIKVYRFFFIKKYVTMKYTIKDNMILVYTNLRYIMNDNWDNKTEDILPLFYDNEFTNDMLLKMENLKSFKYDENNKTKLKKYFFTVYDKNENDITDYINFILHIRDLFKLLNKTTVEHLLLYNTDKITLMNSDLDITELTLFDKNVSIFNMLEVY